MSLAERAYFDQMEANAPETIITNVNRHLERALRVACDCESPDFEALDTIAHAILSARDELGRLTESVAVRQLAVF